MLIFALDSTALTASVALVRDGVPLAAFHTNNGNTHSQTLLPMAQALLACAGVSVDDVDLFACSTGPGSFTGVRIGAATVKGLAFDKGKPCVSVSTLEALAESLVPLEGIFCPVMNARRNQVYNALFCFENGSLHRLCPDRAISIAELCAELAELKKPFYLCGDGADLVQASLTEIKPQATPTLLAEQNAVSVAKCALRAAENGQTICESELKPTYLRLPQAERERLAKMTSNKE